MKMLQLLTEDEREIYAKKLGDTPPWSPDRAEKDYHVGEVTFSAKDGLGSVPFNQSVYYHGFVALIKPSTFAKLALKYDHDMPHVFGIVKLVWDGYALGIPFLQLDISGIDVGEGGLAKVKGHEGRNRMKAFTEIEGDVPVPIHVFLSGGDRNRHLTPEIMAVIEKGVFGEEGNFVVRPFTETILKP